MPTAKPEDIAAELVSKNNIYEIPGLRQIVGGRNNRVLRVDLGGFSFLLKIYFYHPGDERDRLNTEFSFCRFAWEKGIRSLPRPLACNYGNRIAAYEFIEGRQLEPSEISKEYVLGAIDFYLELNRYKGQSQARDLPMASEACFSMQEHLMTVDRRIQSLSQQIEVHSQVDRKAVDFVRNDLLFVWKDIREDIYSNNSSIDGMDISEEIDRGSRCLSPSDFGFHNAILTSDGGLRFIDFEYAGWDDPAKMVCDFFCQPKLRVPMEYYDTFVKRVVSDLPDPSACLQRISCLFPVYQIKWCCIMLNDFLPVGEARRNFASSVVCDLEEKKTRQLEKAQRALGRVNLVL